MNAKLLRLASKDGLGVRRWIIGNDTGRHIRIYYRPLQILASDTDPQWLVLFYEGASRVFGGSLQYRHARHAFEIAGRIMQT